MLIWINGAFGSGKTTVAEALVDRVRDSRLYDPELVGYFLGRVVPESPTGDFQDLPIWRTLVADLAIALAHHYDTPLITPMTVVNPVYMAEILHDLIRDQAMAVHAFTLIVSEPALRQRITNQVMNPDDQDDDERIRQWRLDQVQRCVTALADDPLGEPISNEAPSVDTVIDKIIERLPSGLTRRS